MPDLLFTYQSMYPIIHTIQQYFNSPIRILVSEPYHSVCSHKMRFMFRQSNLLVIYYHIGGTFRVVSQPLLNLESLVAHKISLTMHVQNLLEGHVGNCTVNSTGILAGFPHLLQTIQCHFIRLSFKRYLPGR